MLKSIMTDNYYILDDYISQVINLTKSIILVNHIEAILYNKYINIYHPNFTINLDDKTTWRYYKHITGYTHQLDEPIFIQSIDNSEQILLNKSTMLIHSKTRLELLKFGKYYSEVVKKYPNLELYIKAVITLVNISTLEIVLLPDLSIVGYNSNLIESNEENFILNLQQRLNNYKDTWNLTAYSEVDTLFIASQICILYNYIVTNIIALRLKNAKTIKAHSFHIKNYLASHHELHLYYDYLTDKQRLFLYKNLLYLDNHVGSVNTFSIILKELFFNRNISIHGFDYRLLNKLNVSNIPDYAFTKRLFNNENLIPYNYSINEIETKETLLLPDNSKYIIDVHNDIDIKFKSSILSKYPTKDLETIMYEYTDNVKYKLMQTILDYSAYFCKYNLITTTIRIPNISNSYLYILNFQDVFKLLMVLIYRINGINIINFQPYKINRVKKEILPTNTFLNGLLFKNKYYYNNEINILKSNFITYPTIVSITQFYEFVNYQYLLDIGLWSYISNIGTADDSGQFEMIIDKMFKSELYNINDETIDQFVARTSIDELVNYDYKSSLTLFTNIINLVYDDKYTNLFNLEFVQKALVNIFHQFTSYTTQLISEHTVSNLTLTESKSCKYTMTIDQHESLYYSKTNLNVVNTYSYSDRLPMYLNTIYNKKENYFSKLEVFTPNLIFNAIHVNKNNIFIYLSSNNIMVTPVVFLVSPSSQIDLEFLAMN